MGVFQQIIQNITALSYYHNDQSGIIRRYLAEGKNWNSHLENCKEFILKSLPAEKLNSIAILGSGWLLDVPIDKMLIRSQKVVLYDINHPRQVRNKYGKFEQVTFVKTDLTNNLISIAKKCSNLDEFLQLLQYSKPVNNFSEFDFVVSINLMNQLDILLCDFLMRKFKIETRILVDIREAVQRQHLACLPKGKSCIISDFEEINYLNSIEEASPKSLIFTRLDNLDIMQQWLWTFDTRKTYRKKYNTTFKVFAALY